MPRLEFPWEIYDEPAAVRLGVFAGRNPCGGGQLAVFKAKPDLQLLEHELGAFLRREVHAIGIDVANAFLKPRVPGFLGHLLIDELAHLVWEWRPREPRELTIEFDAVDCSVWIGFWHGYSENLAPGGLVASP